MPLKGTITIPKQLLESDFMNSRPDTELGAFLKLWLWANDRDRQILVNGRKVNVKRGQLARAQSTLAEAWRYDIKKARQFLVNFQNEGLITFEPTQPVTVITVLDYTIYNADTAPDSLPE